MSIQLQTRKVTIYRQNSFGLGYTKIEARKFGFAHREWAQYSNAIQVNFIKKRARTILNFVESDHPSCVVLDGHGHPEPPSAWKPAQSAGNGITVIEGRHHGFSSAWEKEFGAQIDEYIATSGATVLLDCRGNNPYRAKNAGE